MMNLAGFQVTGSGLDLQSEVTQQNLVTRFLPVSITGPVHCAYMTTFWIDPAKELIGIFMTQVSPTYHELLKEIKTIVYQEIVN